MERNYLLMPCQMWSFPGGSVVKNPPANARDTRDMGLIPGSGSPVFNLEKYCLLSINPGGLESAKCYLCEREMLNIWGNSTCVPFRFPCWSPNSQCDGIRRWGPWEVIRFRWDHKGGASQDGTRIDIYFIPYKLRGAVSLVAELNP